MDTGTSDSQAAWHWSRDGVAVGPVDFDELKRLAASGAITAETWVHDPVLRRWVAASTVAGLAFTATAASGAPIPPISEPPLSSDAAVPPAVPPAVPQAAPPAVPPIAPPPVGSAGASSIDPKVAEVMCRVAVLVFPFIYVFSLLAVGIVWAIGASNPRIVAECRQTMNCLLSVAIVGVGAAIVSIVCAIIIIGPFIGLACGLAIFAYCIVVGIKGLVASSNGKPFQYPWAWRLLG
jgi:hypothetical protein